MEADEIADALNSYAESRLDLKRMLLEEQAAVRRVLDDAALARDQAAREAARRDAELGALREELLRSRQLAEDLRRENETLRARLAALEARERRGRAPPPEDPARPPAGDRELEALISKYRRLGGGAP